MSNDPSTIRKLRTPAFYAAIVLYVAAYLALPTREVMTHLFTVWLGEADVHAVHDLTGAAFLWVMFLGVVVQLTGADRRVPALAGTLVGWVVLLGILVGAGSPLVMLPGIFLVLTVLVAVFHPADRAGFRPRFDGGFALVPLALSAVAAVPLLLYAAGQVSLQLGVADSHAADGHYALMATASVLILATGLLASGAGDGWRLPAWGAGGLAVVLGLSSVAFPLYASSVGATWGVLAIGWGVAFVASAEGTTLDTAPDLLRRRVGGTS